MEPTPAALPVKVRRFRYWPYALALTTIAIFAVSPLLLMLIASSIAQAHGCNVDEGSVHPCVIAGTDWGETLNTMTVLCWFIFFTIPAGAIAFVACFTGFLFHRLRWKPKPLVAPTP